MATVPSPRTWTVGELLTAAKMNTDVRDGLNFLLSGKPLCRMKWPGGTSAVGWGSFIEFTTEIVDRDNGHSTSTNQSRYTAQTAGWYSIACSVNFTDEFTGGQTRAITVTHRNSSGVGQETVSATTHSGGHGYKSAVSLTTYFPMVVGDYVDVSALWSDNTEDYFISAEINIEWVGKSS